MKEKNHIMVVDDDLYITESVKKMLEGEGYDVTVANGGTSALAMLPEKQPDLILLDIRMPDLDGYQVLERIRQTSQVPVLMVTAVRDYSAQAQSFNLGADDYIEKPFFSRVLLARIEAKLRRSGWQLPDDGVKKD